MPQKKLPKLLPKALNQSPNDQLKKLVGKKSKYRAQKTRYLNIVYDSKKEAEYAHKLDMLLKARIVVDIKRQVPYCYEIKYCANNKEMIKKGKYIADFVVTYPSGKIDVVDVKGYKTQQYKNKRKIMDKLFNIKILEV